MIVLAPGCANLQSKDTSQVELDDNSARVETTEREDGKKTLRLLKASPVYTEQKTEVWCWAACAAMIHGIAGTEATQEEIVQRVQGIGALKPGEERGASFFEIVRALAPTIGDRTFNEVFEGRLDELAEGFSEGRIATGIETDPAPLIRGYVREHVTRERLPAIDDLKLGHAAFVGLREPGADREAPGKGHAYVMIGATFEEPSEELVRLLEAADEARDLPSWTSELPGFDDLKAIEARLDTLRGWYDTYEEAATSPEAEIALGQMGFDRYHTETVLLLDPYEETAEAAEVSLSGVEFLSRVEFVLSASDAQAIAEKWLRSIEVETTSIDLGGK